MLRLSARQAADAEAEEHIDNVATALARRVDAYDELLFGLRGAYVANQREDELFSHMSFGEHMRSLDFNRRFPGAQVVGIAPLVSRDEVEDYSNSVRANASLSGSVYPAFDIYPQTSDDFLLPISFVYPLPGNENAFGLDFFSEANRRGAAERARDSGEPAATAPVTLVQETGSQQAFLVMVPLYSDGTTPSTVLDRREAFAGVAYAAFRMGDLVKGVIDFRPTDQLEITSLRPRTSLNAIPSEVDESTVIFSNVDAPLTERSSAAQQVVIDVDGQRWGIAARRDFNGATTAALLPYLILLGGFGVTALLAATMSSRVRAERANRAKSDFLSRMSHELRTPLNAVIGFSQLVQLDELGEAQRASVQQIEVAGEHLLELVNDVLEISRIEAGAEAVELEPVDLRSATHGVIDLLRTTADEEGIELRIDDDALAHYALGDRRRVRQTLLNLFSNAIKYNRRGGSVTVVLSSTNQCVRCAVTDTGRGITPTQQLRLFQPFDRLDAGQTEIDGIGLGLMVTKKLIEEMGGQLDLQSTPNEGSTFSFELAAGPASGLAAPNPATGDAIKRTILYLEDESSKRLVMEHVVAPQHDLHLLVAEDSSTALQLMEEHSVDVVIVPAVVQGAYAETIVRELRAVTSREFAVLLVGPDDAEHRRVAESVQASELFTLPMNVSKLRSMLGADNPTPV